jgi:hypothetical protein
MLQGEKVLTYCILKQKNATATSMLKKTFPSFTKRYKFPGVAANLFNKLILYSFTMIEEIFYIL